MNKRRRDCCQSENDHAADKCDAAAEAIAPVTRQRAAQNHPGQAQCKHRTEFAAGYMPLLHERRNGEAQDLNIKTVKNDGERRERGHLFLINRPGAGIKECSYIDRLSHLQKSLVGLAATLRSSP